MANNLYPSDELNQLLTNLFNERQVNTPNATSMTDGYESLDTEEVIDMIEDFFILSYLRGKMQAEDNLGVDVRSNLTHLDKTINKKIDGKTYKDRVREYIDDNDSAAIIKVIGTDSHRIYNDSAYKYAVDGGAKEKTWVCSMLPTSRDTHIYLDGMTKDIDEPFYTYNGDSAMHPGDFDVPEEDINCMCTLTFR